MMRMPLPRSSPRMPLITTVGGTRVQGRGEIEKYLQPRFTSPVFGESIYSASITSARLVRPDFAILDLDLGHDRSPKS